MHLLGASGGWSGTAAVIALVCVLDGDLRGRAWQGGLQLRGKAGRKVSAGVSCKSVRQGRVHLLGASVRVVRDRPVIALVCVLDGNLRGRAWQGGLQAGRSSE